jgi:hypothetical protein
MVLIDRPDSGVDQRTAVAVVLNSPMVWAGVREKSGSYGYADPKLVAGEAGMAVRFCSGMTLSVV